MAIHKFPLSYSIKGRMPDVKKEDAKNGFEVAHISVREVSEIDTSIIGIVKCEEHSEPIRFFEGKYWIKDAYQSKEAYQIRRSGNLIRRDIDKGCASTFIDNIYSVDIMKFINEETVNENTIGFKKVTENKRNDALKALTNSVESKLIEIDGELYTEVSEPIFEVYTSKEPGYPRAYIGIKFLKYEDSLIGRHSLYEYDYSFRFPFDKREYLEELIQHLIHEQGVEPVIYSDGEYYYGAELTPINDDRKNLLNAARCLIDEKRAWENWPVAQLVAWGNLRDAYQMASTGEEDVSESNFDTLSEALKAYEGLQGRETAIQLSTHARTAIYKWENKTIDIDLGFDEHPINNSIPASSYYGK